MISKTENVSDMNNVRRNGGENTLRLNFSNSDEERIEEGIKRLAKIIEKYF